MVGVAPADLSADRLAVIRLGALQPGRAATRTRCPTRRESDYSVAITPFGASPHYRPPETVDRIAPLRYR